ncbi:hypothetical protein BXZ70DRAFT_896568 [Cristinia sonorae]|uniref:Uncharacterized protein n=1 Tax=Cristinia sonorae TaxID=1940300 RepID=A0A8K0UKV8_9AGAR|nr:hypothetical protein BXZ70DRAFT_896568 [Cristinia sonorae]
MSPHLHRPRPILKRDPSPTKQTTAPLPFVTCGQIFSPHVHFPPTPGLTSTHTVYSPQTYDRAPILVSPNICEIPDRHQRRVQTSSSRGEHVKGSYFHPRAYEACEPEPADTSVSSSRPPLLMDDASPSSEEDEIITPPDHYPTSNVPWSSTKNVDEERPILSDVYVSSPVYTVHSTRREGNPWETTSDGKKRRPGLRRMANQPSVKRVKDYHPQFSPRLDEGCLGGF